MVDETEVVIVHDSMINGQDDQVYEQICAYSGGEYQFFVDYERFMKSYGVSGWCRHWMRMARIYIYRKENKCK